jgi:hypothetical protein
MAPYLVLATVARWISSVPVLVLSTVALAWSDADAGLVAMSPGSSTNPVALAMQPLFALFVVLPLTMLTGWIAGRIKPRRPKMPGPHEEDDVEPEESTPAA